MRRRLSPSYGPDDVAAFADVSNPKDAAFFWSGVPECVASDIAQSMDGETLESLTRARGIEMPAFDPNSENVMEAWSTISARYAAETSGMVRVILPDTFRPNSVWNLIEKPILMRNPNVTNIIRVNPDTGEQSIVY